MLLHFPISPAVNKKWSSQRGSLEAGRNCCLPNARSKRYRFRIFGSSACGRECRISGQGSACLGGIGPPAEDGLLQVREIRDLPLRTELVILSACDTGTGRLLGPRGIASLERAFLLAGAKAVIASLWPVDDTYTVALMKRMYERLAAGAEKGVALRQAKLDLLDKFRAQVLPIYWAGFTLVGDGFTAIF